jgi:hypothetical protein
VLAQAPLEQVVAYADPAAGDPALRVNVHLRETACSQQHQKPIRDRRTTGVAAAGTGDYRQCMSPGELEEKPHILLVGGGDGRRRRELENAGVVRVSLQLAGGNGSIAEPRAELGSDARHGVCTASSETRR